MVTEERIQTPSGARAARVWGPPDGPRVLAVHGWLDNAASFDLVAQRLPRLRIVAIDLPGHGLSDHAPPGVLYPFVDFVAAVHEVAEALGWARYSLLGHSLGAGVASILAGTLPDRIERLACIEGLGPMSEAAKHAPERLAKSLLEEGQKRGRRPVVHATRQAAELRLLATPSKMKPSSVQILLARGLSAVPGGVTWRSDPALRLPSRVRLTEEQVLAFLRAITCPTLLIRGQQGYAFVPAGAHERLEALASCQIAELPGGHHLHLDEPGPVAAALAGFFQTELADALP